jgi:phosphoadenosine phosphosulfate reductase
MTTTEANGKVHEPQSLEAMNAIVEALPAQERVRWAVANLSGPQVLSSSFGAQAAVSLHMVTRVVPDIPVVLIDTGYLFPETYRFIDDLAQRLRLNLRVFTSEMSPAWQEARFGKLWEQGLDGLDRYNRLNKVEPMQRALKELGAASWFAVLRRGQSRSRARIRAIEYRDERFKVHPIFDWTDKQVWEYMKQYDLPYHPLWDKGYVSIGDWHTTRPLHEAGSEEETRFFGLKRECGLHGLDG